MIDPTEEYRYCEPAKSDRLARLEESGLLRSQLEAAVVATHLKIIAAKLRERDEPPYELMRGVLSAAVRFFEVRASKQPPSHIPDLGDRHNARWFARQVVDLDDRYERDEASIMRGDVHTIGVLNSDELRDLIDTLEDVARKIIEMKPV